MLADALSAALPMSIGVALSPIPIAACLIILMSGRAARNGPAFLLGWVGGILAVGLGVFLVPGLLTAQGEPTQFSGLVRIALGGVLLVLALRQWLRRPAPEAAPHVPPLLARLHGIGLVQATLTGFLLAAVHPKNLILNAAGAAAIETATDGTGARYPALGLFVLIASTSIMTPVAAYFLARQRAGVMLARGRDWLLRHNVHVLVALLLVLGLILTGRGLRIWLA